MRVQVYNSHTQFSGSTVALYTRASPVTCSTKNSNIPEVNSLQTIPLTASVFL